MLNPNEVDPRHLPSIQAAILKHRSRLDDHTVSKLYKTAKQALTDPKAVGDAKMMVGRYSTANGTVTVTCTDVDSGLFVQLVAEAGQEPLLIFGQKLCQEYRDAMRHNVATKIW